jgi:gamma-glutamyltranspeptidase/glutathione hydrolase
VVNAVDLDMPIGDAVASPRFHHQWWPDQIYVEPGLPPAVTTDLTARGHKVVPTRPATSANSIMVTRDGFVGAPDPRTRGSSAAGY